MFNRVFSSLVFIGLFGWGAAAVSGAAIDTVDDPHYREIVGRVFRLKSPFRVYGHAIEGGRGSTAYHYTMEILSGPVLAGDSKTVFWGTIPKGTLIKLVAVREGNHAYIVELLGPKDKRFEALKLEIIERALLPAYEKSDSPNGIKKLRPMWFEEVVETAD